MKELSNPYIVQLLDVYEKGENFNLVYEYMPNGTLDSLLSEREKLPL